MPTLPHIIHLHGVVFADLNLILVPSFCGLYGEEAAKGNGRI